MSSHDTARGLRYHYAVQRYLIIDATPPFCAIILQELQWTTTVLFFPHDSHDEARNSKPSGRRMCSNVLRISLQSYRLLVALIA
jgi:hypothetical protein